ncbi:hypothetical protein [Parasphingorhabdus sp.]|uniref:hypothetical protein n=1 Tax=Parasphingorhabdus sp. TaxID=2709688 RepID=UPI0032972078
MAYIWPMPKISPITFAGKFYDQIFTPSFFAELADLMGIKPTEESFRALRLGHYRAFSDFSTGQFEQDNFQALKAENARLERVARDAERLIHSLSDLYEFGQTQSKLAREIENNPTKCLSYKGQTLTSLLSDNRPNNPFFDFRELLSDLWVSAKRAIIIKPKNPTPAGYQPSLEELEKLILNEDFSFSGNYEADLDQWRKRRAAHKLQSDHALCRFIEAFSSVWTELSPFPFTQGHYYEKIGHEPSRTVAALKLSFSCHTPNVSAQNIVTAIRKVQGSV